MIKIDDRKTFILAVLMMLNGVLFKFGWVDPDTFVATMTVLTGGLFASVRHAILKLNSKIK